MHAISINRIAINWMEPYLDAVASHTFEIQVWDVEDPAATAPVQTLYRFGRECVITDLLAGTVYHLIMRSENVVGWSAPTEPTVVKTLRECLPPSIFRVSVTASALVSSS